MFDKGVSATTKSKKNVAVKESAVKKKTVLNVKKNQITTTITKSAPETKAANVTRAKSARSVKKEGAQSTRSKSEKVILPHKRVKKVA